MGMFDYVIVEYGLPDATASRVSEWQTKTFDCPSLHKYRITSEGRLLCERVHYEDRSDPTAPEGSSRRFAGAMTPIHEGWDDVAYHGVLSFYGRVGDKWSADGWIEYAATFTDGTLTKIERIPVPA